MAKEENITSITFNRTSNIFINAGIVALNFYLEEAERKDVLSHPFEKNLTEDQLFITSANIPMLLEEVYYFMGREVYDTSGKNARTKPDKSYFTKSPFQAVPFFKMKSYGVAGLITNDPQPVAKDEENSITFKKLSSEDPAFATAIAQYYAENGKTLKDFEVSEDGFLEKKGIKGDSKLFLNEPYIKITRLEPLTPKHLEEGKEFCYLTTESFNKLVDVQNTSPFIKGLNSFSSMLTSVSQKISWKAMFLSRFSPRLCFYSYVSGLDTIVCYFFDSNNLKNLNKLFRQNWDFYKDSNQLIESNYMSNFMVFNFRSLKKDDTEVFTEPKDYTGKNELQFLLIYSLYRKILFEKGISSANDISSFFDLGFQKVPISMISFKADKFSGTLRPNSFEYFNKFKFILSLIIHFERQGVEFGQILQSLKFLKNSDRNSGNSYQLERRLRNQVIGKILNGKSVLQEIELLYHQCFTYLLKGDSIGIKNFKQLTLFTKLYEPIINKKMTKEIQEKAFNLGTSIGMAILNHESGSDKKANAKSGRRYLIDLQKSRTVDQFNQAIIRLQNKYQIIVSAELFKEMLDSENFVLIKQFAVIGALNQINHTIRPIKKNDNNEK